MYLSEKPRPIDFYKEESAPRDMIIEVVSSNGDIPPHHPHPHPHPHPHQHQHPHPHQHPHQHQAPPAPPPPPPPQPHHQMILGESSGEDLEVKAPKKRAETWVQDETRCLIALRREMDSLFNTSKSNKHLWEQISSKMREKGFDRSPTMCTDKWRNLLKEYKKAKYQDRGSAKMSYYKEIEEILRERSKNNQYKSPTASALKVDPYMQFSDKGIEDAGMTFGPVEASGRPTLNLERRLDHDGHPLAITTAEAVAANGVPPWNWRETPGNGESQSYGGRVISVKWGDYTRRVGIDGTADSIKEAIKSAFRLRTKRAFWLEDEDQVIRSLDRDMPLGNYNLQLDEGNSSACWFWNGHSRTNHEIVLARGAPPFVLVTKLHYTDYMDCLCIDLYISGLAIKVCLYDESGHISVHPEDKIFYTEDDYRDFLARRGWTCLRELDGYRNIDNMDDLRPGGIYRGVT